MKRQFNFTKMHGLGNDFIVIDGINQRLDELDYAKMAIQLCDRHFGIGADGIILVLKSDQCDLKMRIFNSDGSEPEMCGNGVRCFARFVYDHKLIDKEIFSIETLAGTIVPALVIHNGLVDAVEVDMGRPQLSPEAIPILYFTGKNVVAQTIEVGSDSFQFTAVSMGNPHMVIFTDHLAQIDLKKIGPEIENHPLFPHKTNVEFAQVLGRNEVVMKVWERGAGETLACGTGACAVVVAGILNQILDRKVLVHLPGGDLSIEWQKSDEHVIMTGNATFVFNGEIEFLPSPSGSALGNIQG